MSTYLLNRDWVWVPTSWAGTGYEYLSPEQGLGMSTYLLGRDWIWVHISWAGTGYEYLPPEQGRIWQHGRRERKESLFYNESPADSAPHLPKKLDMPILAFFYAMFFFKRAMFFEKLNPLVVTFSSWEHMMKTFFINFLGLFFYTRLCIFSYSLTPPDR